MSTKILLLGATGYIGGTVLNTLVEKHPEFEYTAIVRSEEGGKKVTAQLPKVRIVIGSLSDCKLITKESANANIVINAADNDHEASAIAIIEGLSARSPPGYLIHTSGTSILLDWRTNGFGEKLTSKVYDDLDHVDEVTNLPDDAWHRNVDKVVLDGATKNVKTAIICPCCIYGCGTSPGKRVSWQIPQLARWTLTREKGLMVNKGQTHWNNVHVLDLAELYLLLVEEALKPDGGKATWGKEGYYFAENGEHIWADISKRVAHICKEKGLIKSDEVESLTPEEVKKFARTGPLEWGANSRCKALRARKLGWKAKHPSLLDSLDKEVDMAAKALGLL